jgi:TonB family protein
MKRLLALLLLFAAGNALAASLAQKFVDMLADSGDFIKAGKYAALAYAADPLISRLGDSATELKNRDYAKALKIDERLIDDMIARLGPGDAEAKWFSVAVAHKAMALAGLGRDDDALWYWHAAVNLYPDIAGSDMSMFGAPAEFLKAHPLAERIDLPDLGRTQMANIRPPSTIKRVEPLYPEAARRFRVSGYAIFECVIDKSGSVRDLRLLKGLPSPTLTYCAMEALRQWKFQPATLDGAPVDVRFHLTINYKLR